MFEPLREELRAAQREKPSPNGLTTSPRSRHDDSASPSAAMMLGLVSPAVTVREFGTSPALSRRIPHWEGHHVQQGGDTLQECLHRAGAWQREQDAICVLFDLGGNFEEGQDERRGLGLRECGMVEG